MKNTNLTKARAAKNDEFYTRLTDIEKELRHYRDHFRGKVIYCNCDDPETSNFWQYFAMNFDFFGLKKLIATHYREDKPTYMLTLEHDINGNGRVDNEDVVKTTLDTNGDFRSPECIELLKEADIVATNPPFSLFREYVAQLIEYGKQFIIIGSKNAITYKEIFPLLKNNQVWLGYLFGSMTFKTPDTVGDSVKSVPAGWYTNIPTTKRTEKLLLYKHYNPEEFPTYDNYDAINVDKVADIPVDYAGVMGVPITFMAKYNPEQFEILGLAKRPFNDYQTHVYIKDEYSNAADLNAGPVLLRDGVPKSVYARIIIRRK